MASESHSSRRPIGVHRENGQLCGAGVGPTKSLSEKSLNRSLSSIHILYIHDPSRAVGPLPSPGARVIITFRTEVVDLYLCCSKSSTRGCVREPRSIPTDLLEVTRGTADRRAPLVFRLQDMYIVLFLRATCPTTVIGRRNGRRWPWCARVAEALSLIHI